MTEKLYTEAQLKRLMADRKLYIIAEKSGLNYRTVLNFAAGRTESPSHDTIVKLSKYFNELGRAQS